MLNFYETLRMNFLFESSFLRYSSHWNYFKNYWHLFKTLVKLDSLFLNSLILLNINNYISSFVNLETVLFLLKIELRIGNCLIFGVKCAYNTTDLHNSYFILVFLFFFFLCKKFHEIWKAFNNAAKNLYTIERNLKITCNVYSFILIFLF